ncbi:MAG: dihydroorotase [Candidatus Aminicenantes bacterium RBG_19FT_COMBO_59_29]|nr:MAG: dihydroorotase [Candidatus Aminicenantes bacterium RBG_19FT_COMBO_59_29]
MRLLIRNGRVIDPSTGLDDTRDVLIIDGKIASVEARIESSDTPIIDASRLVVAPGFIDMHTHVREPGQEKNEDILSASRAAAKGGFTTICAMPNTNPVNDSRRVTEYIIAEARKRAVIDILPIAAITKGLAGEELTDMAGLAASGAIAFSDDGCGVQNSRVMKLALDSAKKLGALIIDHCEDSNLSQGGVMNEGPTSALLNYPGIPAVAEDVMVSRDIILAGAAGARIHIAHLSTRGAADLVRQAKRREIQVTAEVTPHHVVLSDTALEKPDPNLKVNPPLRGAADVQALLEAIRDGVVDAFATDHAPHSPDQKEVGFARAPFGIDGLETAVSLLLDRLVSRQVIPLMRLVEMFSMRPAQILGLRGKGRVSPGADADLTILSLHQEVTVDLRNLVSKSRNNPFDGWRLKGAPKMTIRGGRVVYPFSHSTQT